MLFLTSWVGQADNGALPARLAAPAQQLLQEPGSEGPEGPLTVPCWGMWGSVGLLVTGLLRWLGEFTPSPSPAMGMNICLVWWPWDLEEEVPLMACPWLSVPSWPTGQIDRRGLKGRFLSARGESLICPWVPVLLMGSSLAKALTTCRTRQWSSPVSALHIVGWGG